MVRQSSFCPFDKDVAQPVAEKGKVIEKATVSNVCFIENTSMAVQVTIFDVYEHCQQDRPLKVS